MKLEFGHLPDLKTAGTGWFIGFSDWTNSSLRHVAKDQDVRGLCVKWKVHQKGDSAGIEKPISEGNTISILISPVGLFRLEFSNDPTFESGVIEHRLSKHGDFSVWGKNIYHRWFVDEDSSILTIRWHPQEAEQGVTR